LDSAEILKDAIFYLDGASLVTGTRSTTTATAHATDESGRRVAHPVVILLLIAGAQLMVVLDATIVNIALPSMAHYFNRSQTDMTWALNAYTLTFGGLLLLGGRAGDILGRRQMFIFGLGLFSIGSLLGGLAPNFQLLLAGRVLQGVGGAIASPTALSLVSTSFPEGKERNRALGVYAAVSGAGAALGLLLGGILTEYLDWRWVLFVNVPIGVALVVAAFLYLPNSERLKGRFDVLGALLSVAGMVSLVYGFINAARTAWSNGTTMSCLISGVILLAAFVYWEMKAADPMMPMRIFANRSRSGAYLVMLVIGAAMFGMFYFLTFFVQGVMGFSALKAGVAFLPVSLVIIVGSGVVAQILPRVGPKILIAIGTILMTIALFFYSTVNADSTYLGKILPGMLILAVGMACIFVPLTGVAVAKVRATDSGLASALLNVGQQVGGSIGLSVLATVAAKAATSSGKSHSATLAKQGNQTVLTHFGELAKSAASGAPVSPAARQDSVAVRVFDEVQAHSAAMGFLTAAIMGVVAVVVAVAVINVKKSDLPTNPVEAVAVA
jgi:EmrB/QacA subfamily drug resistance transporter